MTGIGGTTLAINEGFCVVVSPNVSGIKSKENEPNVVSAYGNINPAGIKSKHSNIIKARLRPTIITTPDSFPKVTAALGSSAYDKYKCVVDEIHCFQEAAGYRDSLASFIENEFDKFERKCVITATFQKLSHPLFAD